MRARAVPILMAVAATFLLAACASSATESPVDADTSVVSGEALGAPMVDDFAGGGETGVVGKEREIIRTAYVSMRVDEVGVTVRKVRDLAVGRGGLVTTEDSQVSGDSAYATITVQIPAAGLGAFIDDISALGSVDSVNVTAQDVTTQVVDLDARITALSTSIDRMSVLLAQAERIEDLLAIESQLSIRQAELDSLTAQRTWLGDQVALSTVTVTLSPSAPLTEVEAPGFVSGLASGWAAFVSVIGVTVTAAGFLLPFAIVLVLVLIPLVAFAVRQSRHRAHRAASPSPDGPSPDGPHPVAPVRTGG